MSEFWQIVIGILASLGGAGAIILGLSSWFGKVWAQIILEKEAAAYRERLERLSKRLEQKNYVSKVRFDAEFEMYRSLTACTLKMVDDTNCLFPVGVVVHASSQNINKQELFNRAHESHEALYAELRRDAAFIPKDFYNRIENMRQLCFGQIMAFISYRLSQNADVFCGNSELKEDL